ncbi:DUF6671 family protein [Flavobacterium sp.]|uniref:DUF6671 family protein n=1 Tax=Flavobacterium sp. TaxID=239 RepID=UPI002486CE8A|nr:DUF6671 family protein [Flavobacterium sp.]MDI1316212.1 hypothetical protein [Flavobacterium sp.]
MFRERTLLIATQHEKEQVIAPILEKELGVKCLVASNFDTDSLGTFSGEVERKDDPITTARNKCLLAMELTNCDMALASEGSFGPHPSIFFAHADDEFLIFIDKKNDLEIIIRELSTDTNFNATELKSEKELRDFATTALFPSHGLILRKHKDDYSKIKKGITDWDSLIDAYHEVNTNGEVFVETDMRAMYNPTRMNVIQKATQKLADKINSLCPQCSSPGFGITDAKPGLPCEWCGFPTRSTLSYIYTCLKCNFKKEEKYPHKKNKEDPMHCDRCNP